MIYKELFPDNKIPVATARGSDLYFLAGAFAGALAAGLAAGAETFAAGALAAGAGMIVAAFAFASTGITPSVAVFAAGAVFELVSAGASAGASGFALKTDTLPVNAGIASKRADSINVVAAVIVTLERTVAVPRGANAELDTLLVNNAPASVLPGCKRTAAISVRHERKNIPYKM